MRLMAMRGIILVSVYLVTGSLLHGQLVAFNLSEAERRLRAGGPAQAQIENLGGLTRLNGFVMDRASGDIILVGRIEKDSPELGLMRLVTAIRAVVGLREWPLVSIDPRPDTPATRKQAVRLEGGIEDTQFGADLLAGLYKLSVKCRTSLMY